MDGVSSVGGSSQTTTNPTGTGNVDPIQTTQTDTLSVIPGTDVLGLGNFSTNQVSIQELLSTSNGALLSFFNQLLDNVNSENFSNIFRAAIQDLASQPTPQDIQIQYNANTTVINASNGLVSSYNGYVDDVNSSISDLGNDTTTAQGNLSTLTSLNASSTLSTQAQAILDAVNQFKTTYTAPNSDGSQQTPAQLQQDLTDFQNQLNTLLGQSDSTVTSVTSAYNDAATTYEQYLADQAAFNNTVTNPPLTEAQWSAQVATTNQDNAALKALLQDIYPQIPNLNPPSISLLTDTLTAPTTTLTSGQYDNSVTFPDPTNYQFVQLDSNGDPIYSQGPEIFHKATDPILDANGNPTYQQIPVVDSNGNPVLDSNGNPEYTNGPQLFYTTSDPVLDANGNPTYEQGPPELNTDAINQFLLDNFNGLSLSGLPTAPTGTPPGAFSTAQGVVTNVTSDVNQFVNTALPAANAAIPSDQTPATPIAVPTLTDYQSSVTKNFVANVAASAANFQQVVTTNLDPGNINPTNNSTNQTVADKKLILQILTDESNSLGSIDLLGSGASNIDLIGGNTTATAVSSSFRNSLLFYNAEVTAQPTLSTVQEAYAQTTGDYLQTVRSAGSVVGSTYAYRDLSGSLNPSRQTIDSVTALNDTEQQANLLGTDYQATLTALAEKSNPNATPDQITQLVSQGTVPFATSVLGQNLTAALPDITTDKAGFTSAYFAAFAQNVIDAQEAKGALNASQAQSVTAAQSSLVKSLAKNNTTVASLNPNNDQLTSEVTTVFQQAGQDLASRGINVDPTQLAKAQSAFLASIQNLGHPGTLGDSSSIPANPLSVGTLQGLLESAVQANITNVSPDVVANSVLVHFIQNDPEYRIQTQNDFKQNENLNQTQAQNFTDRLSNVLTGDSYQAAVQFVANSSQSSDNNFAQEVADASINAADDLNKKTTLEGPPHVIPGTNVLAGVLTVRSDLFVTPDTKRSTYFPV